MSTERATEACVRAWQESLTEMSYNQWCVLEKSCGRYWNAKETL